LCVTLVYIFVGFFYLSFSLATLEEWVTKKKVELTTKKQIETRVKRQVVLEDGKIVEDSGPIVTTNTTEDTEKQEHQQTEVTFVVSFPFLLFVLTDRPTTTTLRTRFIFSVPLTTFTVVRCSRAFYETHGKHGRNPPPRIRVRVAAPFRARVETILSGDERNANTITGRRVPNTRGYRTRNEFSIIRNNNGIRLRPITHG